MILMVDEETRRIKTTADYLREYGYRIKIIDNIDDAYEFVKIHINNIDCLILDMMMPCGKLFANGETENGLLTGYQFFKTVRSKIDSEIPVIFYTAITRNSVIDELNKEIYCKVIRKTNLPSYLISALKEYDVMPENTI